MATPKALLVSPDRQWRQSAAEVLEGVGLETAAESSADEGLQSLARTPVDLVIVESEMEDHDGRWMVRRIRHDYVGKPPRIAVRVGANPSPESIADLEVDAMLIAPADQRVVEAVGLGVARRERQPAADVARELARLSTLSTDLDGALAELA
ncbi:MAG: hypothetical protein KJO07_14025, partial [Deltaproteobacteria bacterium]|nr:hypothetical protein [Deltaproteobacteria bacterium]